MSAKSAADALVKYDATLADQLRVALEGHESCPALCPSNVTSQIIRDASGSWTLSLAAEAAGTKEFDVLVALAQYHLHLGTHMAASASVHIALRTTL
jgi:hypothetical protein